LLACGALLRQMLESTQRLFEGPNGLAVGRPRHGVLPCLSAVSQGLLPHLTPERVVGQPLGLLAEPIPVERLDRGHDPRVKLAATILQQSTVRDLVRERVREGVLEIRIQPSLIQELAGLQVTESATERLVR
jgi:hypothetical protein